MMTRGMKHKSKRKAGPEGGSIILLPSRLFCLLKALLLHSSSCPLTLCLQQDQILIINNIVSPSHLPFRRGWYLMLLFNFLIYSLSFIFCLNSRYARCRVFCRCVFRPLVVNFLALFVFTVFYSPTCGRADPESADWFAEHLIVTTNCQVVGS